MRSSSLPTSTKARDTLAEAYEEHSGLHLFEHHREPADRLWNNVPLSRAVYEPHTAPTRAPAGVASLPTGPSLPPLR